MKRIILAALVAATVLAIPTTASAQSLHVCRQGDPPITASMQTSCGFAGNAVTMYANSYYGRRRVEARIWSPARHRTFHIRFVRRGDFVTATGANGIWLRFYAAEI